MLILIGILPAQYALDPDMSQKDIAATRQAASELAGFLNAHDGDILQSIAAGAIELPRLRTSAHPYKCGLANAIAAQAEINQQLAGIRSFAELPPSLRYAVRNDILCLDDAVRQISLDLESLNLEQLEMIDDWRKQLRQPTEYAPDWVLLAVSVALGLGTMVGWRRHGRDLPRRRARDARLNDPRSLLWRSRDHGRQPLWPAVLHPAVHLTGVGADPSRCRRTKRGPVLALHLADVTIARRARASRPAYNNVGIRDNFMYYLAVR